MHLENFLKLILPNSGQKCWISISKKGVKQGFVDSVEKLAEQLKKIDAQGIDAYFGCAVFGEAFSRKTDNAVAAKSFWLDLDCGEGKPYAAPDLAIEALDNFANALGIALPVIVNSGYGVHAYWVLKNPIDSKKWQECSKIFKLATEQCGLQADPARTSDIASILRPPETHNYKRGGKALVEVQDSEIEYITIEDFEKSLRAYVKDLPAVAPLTSTILNTPHAVNSAILGGKTGAKFNLNEGCKEGGRNQRCAELAGWLMGTCGKTYEETVMALLKWNQLNAPPMDDLELKRTVQSIAGREAQKPKTDKYEIITQYGPRQIPKLIKPYSCSGNDGTGAMWAAVETEDGDIKPQRFTPFGLHLIDVCRKESIVHGAYVFAQFHPRDGWHEFTVTTEEFMGSSWMAIMARNAADITNHKIFRQYVFAVAEKMKMEQNDKKRYEQFGWKEDHSRFLIGAALLGINRAPEFAYGDTQLEPRMKAMTLQPGTSLAAWSAAANSFYAVGFEPHGFGLLTGFAAPLMTFLCGKTDGGAMLALYSRKSGAGKSKILEALASIYGAYDGLSLSRSDTANAKFNKISKACHLPVYEEELTAQDPDAAADMVKRFTEGRDKDRAKRDGSVEMRNTYWQVYVEEFGIILVKCEKRLSPNVASQARKF